MTAKLFSDLGLSAEVLKAIDKLGFEQAAPIQASAIPILMEGRDVAGKSQTGSGKTAAFAIPAIEKVDTRQRGVQVLILCPTRELAIQVSEEVHKLALFKSGIHALPIYGGQSFDRQLAGFKQGANIVIGTPGRVMDHLRRGTLKLAGLKMVVLDEVDVMLNMGFRDDIEIILQEAPTERQTVFFSATIPRPIQQLIEKYSRNPQQVHIEQKALTVPTVDQIYYETDRKYKIELLTRLIDIHDLKLGIIFCNTKRMVDDLVEHLNAQGYSADGLHGDMTQLLRDRVMNKFRKSGLEFLVATDLAARGIDVDDIQVVFNYDLPYDVEDYLHRIGRTGRAGRSGMAVSFVAGREMMQIQNIERFTKVRIRRGKPPTVGEVEEARTLVFLDKLRATLTSGDFKKQDHIIELLLEEGFSSTDIASALMHQLQAGDAAASTKKVSREREVPPRPRPAPVVVPAPPPKPSVASPKPGKFRKGRRPSVEQTRLWMNVGEAMGVVPIDVVNAVAEKTGFPGKVVGTIDVRERHLFADVSSEHAEAIIEKLNRSELKGHKIKVKLA
jgi:ATP-dependent RNA helicase DeaD